MLVVDDLNSWVGCLARREPRAQTPAINGLAAQGSLFRHAYCPAPYCNASRMAVFSGCWPSRTGVYEDQAFWDQSGRPRTYLEVLKAAGYQMWGAGKVLHGRYAYGAASAQAEARWLDLENRPFLWDRFVPSAPQPLPPRRPLHGIRHAVPSGRPLSPQLDWGVMPAVDESRSPDAITAATLEHWLANPPREPFFMAAGFYSPHLPWYAPERFWTAYPPGAVALPPAWERDLEDLPPLARQWVEQQSDHATILAHGQWRQAVRAYLAAVSFADAQVGRVLAALAASPAREHTTVVLWSDNGFHLGEKLRWRKFTLWEEATRVPLIVVPSPALRTRLGPLRPQVEQPVSVLDLFPTLLELEQIEALAGVDGQSLLPWMVAGSERPLEPRPVLMSWGAGNHSIRLGPWRYIRYRDGGEELYDLQRDPEQWHNRSGDPALAVDQQQLRRALDQLLVSSTRQA